MLCFHLVLPSPPFFFLFLFSKAFLSIGMTWISGVLVFRQTDLFEIASRNDLQPYYMYIHPLLVGGTADDYRDTLPLINILGMLPSRDSAGRIRCLEIWISTFQVGAYSFLLCLLCTFIRCRVLVSSNVPKYIPIKMYIIFHYFLTYDELGAPPLAGLSRLFSLFSDSLVPRYVRFFGISLTAFWDSDIFNASCVHICHSMDCCWDLLSLLY